MLPQLHNRCYRCGLTLTEEHESIYCESCQQNPPHFDRVCAALSYDPPARQLVHQLKFKRNLAVGRLLSQLLLNAIAKYYQPLSHQQSHSSHPNQFTHLLPKAIIPVPLHPSRLRSRGFNQAIEISRAVQKHFKIPILYDVCERTRKTQPQSRLGAKHRSRNLQSAFKVIKPIPYDHIAIIDDVLTTGSTVNALCRVLKKSGVEIIDIWCISRA